MTALLLATGFGECSRCLQIRRVYEHEIAGKKVEICNACFNASGESWVAR